MHTDPSGRCQDSAPPDAARQTLGVMPRSVRLRPWQKAALERFHAHDGADFLAVATPGAGKTTFALTAAVQHLGEHPNQRVVVVAPTQHLKLQWSRAAARLDLHLEPQWSPARRTPAGRHARGGRHLPAGGHAGPATCAPIAARRLRDLRRAAPRRRRPGLGRRHPRWPSSGAARRLALSGTPFRSDTTSIPFVPYDDFGEARSDYEYGYGEALTDGGVVRPSTSPASTGTWSGSVPTASEYSCSFDDALDAARSGQRLRTALSLTGEWLPAVLDQAHEQLTAIRAVAAPRRRADHRHRPRARPGHRRPHAPPPRGHADPGAQRRPDGVGPHRALRRGIDAVDRGRAHGVRGRRHPPPARRRVRHQHRHRAVLPPGRRPPRALDPGHAPPEGLLLHPRRPPPAHLRGPDRRAAAPQPAPPRRRRAVAVPSPRRSTSSSVGGAGGAALAVLGDLGGGPRPPHQPEWLADDYDAGDGRARPTRPTTSTTRW